MDKAEWSEKAGNELDELSSSANHVLQEMLSDGSWEGTDPAEQVRQVIQGLLEPEVTSAFSGWVAVLDSGDGEYDEPVWRMAPKKFWEENHCKPDHEADISIPGFTQVEEHTFVAKLSMHEDEAEALRRMGFEVIMDWEW